MKTWYENKKRWKDVEKDNLRLSENQTFIYGSPEMNSYRYLFRLFYVNPMDGSLVPKYLYVSVVLNHFYPVCHIDTYNVLKIIGCS